ncbi:flagellar protein FlgN [Desulfovibrio sp. OttesenSCG-928-G11]|nr:flagellar protein FlgN [Desulfovibrio sp. OttesenSCG-928-G11]
MYDIIQANLTRQFKGLELLAELLEEEFTLLCKRDTDAVTTLEFSIHELLRQIATERVELKKSIQGASLLEYAGMIEEEQGQEARRLYHIIDALEQRCSRQATRNTELSLALLDQSQSLLLYLHGQIAPKQSNCYGARGQLTDKRPMAALYSGRF